MLLPFIFAFTFRAPVVPSTHGACTQPDFDRDGVIDSVETVEDSCGTGGCVYRLALANGTYLGTIDGKCSFVLQPRGHHLADIVTTWSLGTESVVTRYRFSGGRYRRAR